MSVSLIDDALYGKIQGWVKDPKMVILKPNETLRLFQTVADQTGDAPLTLPLIALSRDSDIEINQTNKRSLSFSGSIIEANATNVQILNAIPIEVNYQLDIYTKNYVEGDEYLRNFIFNFINYPRMIITIPYNNVNFEHTANVRVGSIVTDTSDIPQRLFPGQFTRWTIKLSIDDCYLFSVPVLNTPHIEMGVAEVMEPTNKVGQSEDMETGGVEAITSS